MSGQNGDFANPTSIQELEPKMRLRGTVKQIELAGAFIDLGLEYDGMLHISRLSHDMVHNVSDVISEGDEIAVWVHRVDKKAGRIELTLVEPLGLEWRDIKTGQVYTGQVVRLENFGAFVDIGAERPGLVHVSELSSGYVNSPQEVVSVGDDVQVKVIGVDRRKRQIDLSIKAMDMDLIIEEEEDEEELPTIMELAFQRAMKDAEDANAKPKGKSKAERGRQDVEDAISRTLQQHQKKG